jgi:hypothetical protein
LLKGIGKSGWAFVETLIVIAILGMLVSIFGPPFHRYWKRKNACERAVKIHEEIAPIARRLIEIYVMPKGTDREDEMNAFRSSEEGSVFFDEFCPAYGKCWKPADIQKDYSVSLTLLCLEK